MGQDVWNAVDGYVVQTLVQEDDALREATKAGAQAGLPPIAVSPNQGKLLHIMARSSGSRSILEIGTLGGYSTIWLARALPVGGRLVTLEANPRHAEVARANIARAGLDKMVEVKLGPALETLPVLAQESSEPFDFVFIDADKQTTPEYVSWALDLTRPGALIIVDNVVRAGAVIDGDTDDPSIRGIRRANEMLSSDPRISATAIQMVGSKGYDGFAVALVGNS